MNDIHLPDSKRSHILGLRIYEGYGQTETTLLCCMYKGIDYRPGSMGKPAPGYNLKASKCKKEVTVKYQVITF